MPRLSPVSFNELVRKLKALGFEGPISGGKHLFMIKGDVRLNISNPHRRDIAVNLLKRILSQAGIQRDEWDRA